MILHLLPNEPDGCSYHRIEIPMHNLQGFDLAQSSILDGISDSDLQKTSLIVMSRDSCVSDVTGQIKRLKKLGIPYVVDFDDYWKLNKEHLLYKDFKVIADRWIELMKGASAVTTTNSRLAGKIQFHNKNVIVCPNALDETQPQWAKRKKENEIPVFGYMGGSHHLPDLQIMVECFKEIHKTDFINLALGGWNEGNEVYKIYEWWMTGGKYAKYKRIKGENVYNYGLIYDFVDVSLVPLLESKFTACKSNLKLIEAGFKGCAVISSKCPPYTDEFTDKEVVFVEFKSDWFPAIKDLHENPEKLFDYKESLKEKAKNYEIKKVNPIREQLYKSIINGK